MKETWIKIIGFEDYEVNESCEIRIARKGKPIRILKKHISKTGYYSVRLYKYGKGFTKKCHRLGAIAFLPNDNNLPQVNHKDGNKLNNHISNLEWVTNYENISHAFANGLIPKCVGQAQSSTILTDESVLYIFSSRTDTDQLASQFNVHPTTINNIKTGKSWGWLTGKKYTKRILNVERILQIFNSHKDQLEIAADFKVSRQFVNSIKIGAIYSEITGAKYKKKITNRALITADLVKLIFNSKEQTSKLAKKLNVSTSTVRKIRSGEIYSNFIKTNDSSI